MENFNLVVWPKNTKVAKNSKIVTEVVTISCSHFKIMLDEDKAWLEIIGPDSESVAYCLTRLDLLVETPLNVSVFNQFVIGVQRIMLDSHIIYDEVNCVKKK